MKKILDFNKQKNDEGIEILTPKQMVQRLSIALVQVKAGNTSENLLNEIKQILIFLYREKEVHQYNVQQYNELHKFLKKNGYYIYEFWE